MEDSPDKKQKASCCNFTCEPDAHRNEFVHVRDGKISRNDASAMHEPMRYSKDATYYLYEDFEPPIVRA
jgi:hypothetical protein